MRQTLTLYNEDKQLIRTTSPDEILNLSDGEYIVDDNLKSELLKLWSDMEEYGNNLTLTVING